LREERRLRVLQNRLLKRIFGPKRGRITGERRKLHNEELNDLYSFFFYLCKIVTTRASPQGIPRDIYRGETQSQNAYFLDVAVRYGLVVAQLGFPSLIQAASGGCC
jgi:hypothetical protein